MAEEEPVVAEPAAPTTEAKPSKVTKKSIVREALRNAPPGGISADDITQMVIDAGLALESDRDKTRHYVIMSISHMRKAGEKIELKEKKYALVGDQSSA